MFTAQARQVNQKVFAGVSLRDGFVVFILQNLDHILKKLPSNAFYILPILRLSEHMTHDDAWH
jgi:hypothetical protein